MTVRLLAFTDRGLALAQRLGRELPGEARRCGEACPLDRWTAEGFQSARGLVFVGAVGIAVRAIVPYVRSKATDPAVVVVDEGGRFAVPILSGHLGGANDLARRIGSLCGAMPVITTATDVRGIFAVDEWAKRQSCLVQNPEAIKTVSGKLLAGETVYLYSPWPVAGTPPPGVAVAETAESCDFCLSVEQGCGERLCLTPRIVVLGVGCRRGTSQEALEEAFAALAAESGLASGAVRKVCTIDLKRNEPGLLAFCQAHGFAFETFSAGALARTEGAFSPSEFVRGVTGVDNVCERSAVLGSGGRLYVKKRAGGGVTMAAALAPFAPDWRYQNG